MRLWLCDALGFAILHLGLDRLAQDPWQFGVETILFEQSLPKGFQYRPILLDIGLGKIEQGPTS